MIVALSFTHQNLMAQSIHPSEVLFQTYHIEVYDLSGRKIITQQNVTFPYDTNKLRKGMYLVYIQSESGYSQTEKTCKFLNSL
jgi:hypothetical protein